MKKKLLSAVFAAMLAVGSLAGCGKKASEAGTDKTKIEFWTIDLKANFEDYFKTMIANYEKENPNVEVNWTDIPYADMQSKLVAAVAGGTAPDVVNLNTQFALTLAGKGALVDLNKEATAEQKAIYNEGLWNSAKIGDSVYAFPWYASPDIMFSNKELMAKAGITEPHTYAEALKEAEDFYNKTGAYLFLPDGFFNMLVSENIDILSKDGKKAAFNTDKTVALLEQYKALTDKGVLPKTNWGSWDEALKLFESSKLAIVSSSGSSLARIKDEAPDVYKLINVSTPLTGSNGLSRNPLMNLVVPTASKNHEAAIKFANYVTNDDNQLAFCKLVSIFPSTTKASEDPFFTSNTSTLEGEASAMSAKASLTSQDFSLGIASQDAIATAINKAYEASIINGEDIRASLKQAEEDVNKILSEAK